MKVEELHSVYFIGIGGIGMSALARWFHANGKVVAGYDKTSTHLTRTMEAEGIPIHYSDNVDAIPEQIKTDSKGSLIVYTPAVPKSLNEYQLLLTAGHRIYKRSEVLGLLTRSKFTIAVAGTHGKTTTSSMIAHLLRSSGVDCSAFVGGIMTNYNSNLLIGKDDAVIVVEADEFDRSFLTLHPDVAIITAADADHLDIYGTKDSLKDSFLAFVQNIKENGKLFVEERVAKELNLSKIGGVEVLTYGIESGDISAVNINIRNAKFSFELAQNGITKLEGLSLQMPGFHNVANATAALSAAGHVVKESAKLINGMASYAGVKRRFEYIINTAGMIFIDDYAHHPEEINALLKSVRALYPEKMITAIFQPHLFSRTRDFIDEFAASLSQVDQLILLDIYPARELPIPGITSDVIAEKVNTRVTRYQLHDVLEYFEQHKVEVLLTIGAGDIDTLVEPIKNKLLS